VDFQRIEQGDSGYPRVLGDRLDDEAPSCVHLMGEAAILRHRLVGLVCSIQCPGSIVIETLDAIRTLRDAGVVVVGGFHSLMEDGRERPPLSPAVVRNNDPGGAIYPVEKSPLRVRDEAQSFDQP
jgi:hypothetical protein